MQRKRVYYLTIKYEMYAREMSQMHYIYLPLYTTTRRNAKCNAKKNRHLIIGRFSALRNVRFLQRTLIKSRTVRARRRILEKLHLFACLCSLPFFFAPRAITISRGNNERIFIIHKAPDFFESVFPY